MALRFCFQLFSWLCGSQLRFSVGLLLLLLSGCRSPLPEQGSRLVSAQRLKQVLPEQVQQLPDAPDAAKTESQIVQFEFASDFSEGLAAVKVGDR